MVSPIVAKPDKCYIIPAGFSEFIRASPMGTRRDGAMIFDGLGRASEMQNLFQPEAVTEVVSRIDKLQPTTEHEWGKMDVAQMMAHCSTAFDLASGRVVLPQLFIGKILGPFVRPIFTNDKPFSRNSPTDKKLVIADKRDFAREQEQLKGRIQQFHEGGEAKCTRHPHPFFGALTPQQWATGMYKHLDHHLRQFGV
jgi:hypothetical protein